MSQNWVTYEDKVITEYDSVDKFPENCIGFVYRITNIQTGKFYIGRKSLYSNVRKKLTKKELSELSGPGRKPTKKLVTSESNWMVYWGSNKGILQEIKEEGTSMFRREILKFCFNKKQLTYWELHYQCVESVLLTDKSYNDNILAKFFRKDLVDSE
jgi:Putative endonuclease segE, GIY-YIG domain